LQGLNSRKTYLGVLFEVLLESAIKGKGEQFRFIADNTVGKKLRRLF